MLPVPSIAPIAPPVELPWAAGPVTANDEMLRLEGVVENGDEVSVMLFLSWLVALCHLGRVCSAVPNFVPKLIPV